MRRLAILGGMAIAFMIVASFLIHALTPPQNVLLVTGNTFVVRGQPTRPASTCTTPQHKAGESYGSLLSGGIKRTFLVHLPPDYGMQPQPLVLTYHGYSWTSQIMESNTHMNVEADKAGFVLVFPQGVDSPPSWNAGVGAYGPTGDADDIQFTRDLLSYLEKNYCIDTHRVYIDGFSLGGGMAYRLACTLTDQLAAVATVSGAYYPLPEGCHPSRPIPILEIHGAADQLAPYNGNTATRMEAVQNYLDGWLQRDGCTNTPQTFFQQGDVTAMQWTNCTAGSKVVHYRISDGAHTWPGSPGTTHVIDANVVLWNFFAQYRNNTP